MVRYGVSASARRVSFVNTRRNAFVGEGSVSSRSRRVPSNMWRACSVGVVST